MNPVRRIIPERYRSYKIDAAGIAVCAVMALVFYWVTVQPLVQGRAAVAGQRRDLEAERTKIARVQAAAGGVQEQLARVQAALAASAIKLEPAAHINKRVVGLTQFFSDRGLEVDDVQTGAVHSGPQYDLVPITVVGRGPYKECISFFHGLPAAFPDMSVVRIELSGVPGPAAPEKFQFEFLWYAAPGKPAVACDAPSAPREATR
jgi:Tfp pilus assembly protein PilO